MDKHWVKVFRSLLLDSLLFAGCFLIAVVVRHHGEVWNTYLPKIWTGIVIGSVAIGCICYMAGMYASHTPHHRHPMREVLQVIMMVSVCHGLSVLLLIMQFYFNFSSRIGRGTMLIGASLSWIFLLLHHLYLHRAGGIGRADRIACVMSSSRDEDEAVLLRGLNPRFFNFVGVIPGAGYTPRLTSWHVIGTADDLVSIARRERLDQIVFSTQGLADNNLRDKICQLRYSGVRVLSLLQLCEEVYQCTPVPLVTPQWLLGASDSPQVQYIKQIKRAFDVVASLVGLLVLSPLLLAGMLAVRLTSPGPVIFRQIRVGRFGRTFELLKLRTMCQNAESDGAEWSRSDDPRVTPVGRILRKYRIDEIPQLINVLRGEMSFVGPRPERPEFIEMLSEQIPYFGERLMAPPGVTGWAQVNYSYGASVLDARRKLEYDLYYLKHMGIFLDLLILLDTVRTVMRGTVWHNSKNDLSALIRLAEEASELATDQVAEQEPATIP